jgi:hypothetical protein
LTVNLGRNSPRHGWLCCTTIHFLLFVGTYLVFSMIFAYGRPTYEMSRKCSHPAGPTPVQICRYANMPTCTGQNNGKVHTDDCRGQGGDPCGVTTNLQEVIDQIVTSTPTAASAQFSVMPPAYKINLGNE